MGAYYAYISEIPIYPSDINLDLPGQWRSGDLVYVEADGYRYYDGTQWKRLGVGLEQLALATRTTDLNVASGQTVTAVTTQVTITDQTQLLARASIPMLEFTATSGGEAQIIVNYDGTPYVVGHMVSDRQFGWPATMSRTITNLTPGTVTVTLQVTSVNAACIAHAGAQYGDTMLRLIA
jgi:hypothetical protein